MAEVPVTITGVICDLTGKTITGPVKLVGSLVRTDLSVGGGPIVPPEGGGGSPPGIWGGPIDPYPGHPLPQPPGTWPGQNPPHPAHPIVNPPEKPPTEPPTEPPTQPAEPQWVWGYTPTYNQWLPVYVPAEGQPGPK